MGALNIILSADGDGKVTDTSVFNEDHLFATQSIAQIIYGYPVIFTELMFERAVPGISYFCKKFASVAKKWMFAEIGKRAVADDTFGTLNIFGDSECYKDLLECDNISVLAVAVPSKRNQLFSYRQWKLNSIITINSKWDLMFLVHDENYSVSDDAMNDEIERMEDWLNEDGHEISEQDDRDLDTLVEALKAGQERNMMNQNNIDAFRKQVESMFNQDSDDESYESEFDGDTIDSPVPPIMPPQSLDSVLDDAPASLRVVKLLSETLSKTADIVNGVSTKVTELTNSMESNKSKFDQLQDIVQESLRENSEYVIQRMNELNEREDGIRTQIANVVRDQLAMEKTVNSMVRHKYVTYIMNAISFLILIAAIIINY